MKILVVDDNKRVRDLIKHILNRELKNNIFIECEDGESAVKICEAEKIDLVLMDIIMDRLDGLKAAQKITSTNHLSKIIIVSQLSEQEYKLEALAAGAVDFLNKENLSELPNMIKILFSIKDNN